MALSVDSEERMVAELSVNDDDYALDSPEDQQVVSLLKDAYQNLKQVPIPGVGRQALPGVGLFPRSVLGSASAGQAADFTLPGRATPQSDRRVFSKERIAVGGGSNQDHALCTNSAQGRTFTTCRSLHGWLLMGQQHRRLRRQVEAVTSDEEISGRPLAGGAPGGIRTPGLQIRSLPLYPAELRAREIKRHSTSSLRKVTGRVD